MSNRKVLLVGWDAADWKVIHTLMDHGLMPHTRRLVERGVMANLATLSPVLSPMLWTSIATGKRPFKHGIHGFTEPTADGKAVQPVTNLSRRTKAVWNILSQNGKRCQVVGWWPSHPAEPINGVMVSNRYQRAPIAPDARWPMLPGTVHPPRLADTLAELRVHPLELGEEHIRPFIPHAEKIDQGQDRRLDMCLRTIADCTSIHSCVTHLLEHEPWDFAAVYYDAIDHFGHGFMKYHPPRRESVSEEDFAIYQNVISAGYVYHDMMLGRLVELAGEKATVILMSDHGFHSDHLRPEAILAEPAGPAIEHRDFGILVIAGPGIKQDQIIHSANLLDITPTILALFGLAVAEDMDGKPLVDAFETPPEINFLPSWDDVRGEDGRHPPDRRLDPDEARETLEQLVALGYIERPADDQREAVAQTVRELNYNLALAYIDAGQHPKAAELLAELYRDYPLEFRFGIRLALCLSAIEMIDEMAAVVESLNSRWAMAAHKARERLKEVAALAKERRKRWKESQQKTEKDPSEENGSARGKARPQLFTDAEHRVIGKLRAIARGNQRTLDYLAGNVAIARKDNRKALEYLAQAEATPAKSPGFYLHVGNTYLELKKYQDAQRSFRQALEIDPQNPRAHLGLCRCQLKRRRYRDARQSAVNAVALKYHFPAAHYFLAIATARLGNAESAIDSLKLAIEQNPNFPEAHNRLARIYKRLGDEESAHEHRWMAEGIRRERKRQRASRTLPKLVPIDNVDFDGQLPELPEPSESKRKPPLAVVPIHSQPPGEGEASAAVTVVSGLPRSGTSLLMQMLAAGGLTALADSERAADQSNPRGYFELEKTKRLASDNSWLDEARGKALKVVAPLVPMLPQGMSYRVVFMERDLDEIVASQRTMLDRLGEEGSRLAQEHLVRALSRQVAQAKKLLQGHRIPVLTVAYAEVIRDPAAVARCVAEFLPGDLDVALMAQVVDPTLYRQRK